MVAHTSKMGVWFSRRNLRPERQVERDLPREAVIYLMVTWAKRPEALPPGALQYLARNYLGHCAGGSAAH